jgi:hypothetical protein
MRERAREGSKREIRVLGESGRRLEQDETHLYKVEAQ